MQTRQTIPGIMAAISAMLSIPSAHAQTFYTDKNAFNNASTIQTDITFEGVVGSLYPQTNSSGYAATYDSNGVLLDGTRFVGFGYVGPGKSPETYIYSQAAVNASIGHDVSMNGSGYTLWGGREYIDISLPSGITAFGTDYAFVNATGTMDVTVDFHNGTNQNMVLSAASRSQFFGVTGSEIDHITLHSPAGDSPGDAPYMEIDNVLLGTEGVTTTPEPGSIALLIGTGVTSSGLIARRRRARKVA